MALALVYFSISEILPCNLESNETTKIIVHLQINEIIVQTILLVV